MSSESSFLLKERQESKRFALISYSGKDQKRAQWLQRSPERHCSEF